MSFVKRLIRRYQDTGQVKPKSHGGGARALIKVSDLEEIKQLVDEQPDAIAARIMRALAEKEGNQSQHFHNAP